ncbi:MAG: sulfatase-like hydrolase/transferase [Pirellulales bacterium]
MHRSIRVAGLIGFISAAVLSSLAIAKPANILFILADDVGQEVLNCYGGTSYQTPQIDRLAAGGTRFEHAYAMPMCHPTRTTLLTGQYPFRLGHVAWGSFPREAEDRTLASVLKQAGYATAVAGKWQMSLLKDDLQQPHRMGFDEYCVYGWHEGPWYYRPYIWQNGNRRTDIIERYGPDVICEFLIDFIEQNKDRPFFAYYSMALCHAETNDLEAPAPVGPNGRYDSFAEMVEKMDERVGRIVAALDRFGVRDSTLVIFLGDNGTAKKSYITARNGKYVSQKIVSMRGGREIPGGKGTLTDLGTRVPLIVNWPHHVQPDQVSNELTDVSDFLPSLANVAGARLPEGVVLDGQSLGLLTGDEKAPRHWAFAEHGGKCFVRNQHWKLYRDGRFYDMESDPEEGRPLSMNALSPAASLAHRELQQALTDLNYNTLQSK